MDHLKSFVEGLRRVRRLVSATLKVSDQLWEYFGCARLSAVVLSLRSALSTGHFNLTRLIEPYPHRYADIILHSDYELRKEIDQVVKSIDLKEVDKRFAEYNSRKEAEGKKLAKGRQATINLMLRERFQMQGWEIEKNVFDDPENDLKMDFWKRQVGVDVAFNHRSFIGGDLLRLQAAAEVKNIIRVGIYICPTKEFAKYVSPGDASSMVSFERTI